jgi:MinD-like ATPase involved in chromosome partitioning or flagellar assembly
METQNLLYFYEMPKDSATSIQLAQKIKEATGLDLTMPPQFKRDPNRYFYSAVVKINDNTKFKEACEKLKYFEINGKPCRALPFDKELLGAQRAKLANKNIFVKNIPKEKTAKDLDSIFSQYGSVKSAKLSINADHSSRGYGFVLFNNEDDVTKVLQNCQNQSEMQVTEYAPRDKREI